MVSWYALAAGNHKFLACGHIGGAPVSIEQKSFGDLYFHTLPLLANQSCSSSRSHQTRAYDMRSEGKIAAIELVGVAGMPPMLCILRINSEVESGAAS